MSTLNIGSAPLGSSGIHVATVVAEALACLEKHGSSANTGTTYQPQREPSAGNTQNLQRVAMGNTGSAVAMGQRDLSQQEFNNVLGSIGSSPTAQRVLDTLIRDKITIKVSDQISSATFNNSDRSIVMPASSLKDPKSALLSVVAIGLWGDSESRSVVRSVAASATKMISDPAAAEKARRQSNADVYASETAYGLMVASNVARELGLNPSDAKSILWGNDVLNSDGSALSYEQAWQSSAARIQAIDPLVKVNFQRHIDLDPAQDIEKLKQAFEVMKQSPTASRVLDFLKSKGVSIEVVDVLSGPAEAVGGFFRKEPNKITLERSALLDPQLAAAMISHEGTHLFDDASGIWANSADLAGTSDKKRHLLTEARSYAVQAKVKQELGLHSVSTRYVDIWKDLVQSDVYNRDGSEQSPAVWSPGSGTNDIALDALKWSLQQ